MTANMWVAAIVMGAFALSPVLIFGYLYGMKKYYRMRVETFKVKGE